MITSIDSEKACGKIQRLTMIKTLSILGIKRAFLNLVKAILHTEQA